MRVFQFTLFIVIMLLSKVTFAQNDSTLNLIVSRYGAIQDTISQLKKAGIDTLRNGEKFPVVQALGRIHLNLSYDSVTLLLGRPMKEEEIGQILVLTYPLKTSKTVKIGIGKSERVIYVITNSSEVSIPRDLTVGNRIEQFEVIYGSRRYRKTEPISLNENLYIYPFSNLSLIADSKSRIVKIIMITKSN